MNIQNTISSNIFFSNNKTLNFLSLLFFIFPITIITGPFLPDLILTLIALIGLFLFFFKKIKPFFYFEIKILWTFYLIIIISSLLSDEILYSLDYSLFYFRFIIFAHFFIFLILKYENMLKNFFFGIIVCLFLLNLYSILQIINFFNLSIEYDGVRRLHLLFSDEEIVGSFLIRILPIYIFLIYLYKNFLKSNKFKLFNIFLISLSIVTIIFSGERTAMLLLSICILFLSIILIKKNLKVFLIIIFTLITGISSLLIIDKKISERVFQDYDRNISINPELNPYLNFSLVSFNMFKDSPFFGQGPKMFRKLCNSPKFNDYPNNCNMHPHSIYAQLLGETGIFAFLIVFSSFFYFLYKNFLNIISKNFDFSFSLATLAFIINFFLLIPSGNFFNNWINSLYYLSILLVIYHRVLNKNR